MQLGFEVRLNTPNWRNRTRFIAFIAKLFLIYEKNVNSVNV